MLTSERRAVVQATTSTTTGGRRAVGGPTHQAAGTRMSQIGAITVRALAEHQSSINRCRSHGCTMLLYLTDITAAQTRHCMLQLVLLDC